MKLWTIWSDNCATGEGRTLTAMIVYAKNAEEAKKKFGDEFGEYHEYMVRGCDAEEGVVKNDVTKFLFSAELMKIIPREEGKAHVVVFAECHVNKS